HPSVTPQGVALIDEIERLFVLQSRIQMIIGSQVGALTLGSPTQVLDGNFVKTDMAPTRRPFSLDSSGEQIDLDPGAAQGADHFLDVDGATFPAENRNAGIHANICESHFNPPFRRVSCEW